MATPAKPAPIVFDPSRDSLDYPFDYNPEETDALKSQLQGNTKVTLDDLRRVSLWKINRVLEVPDSVLGDFNELTALPNLTHRMPKAIDVLEALVDSRGVGYPMASSMLKFVRPDVFPIIDVRAYRALFGRKLYASMYTTERYLDYADRCHEIAESQGIPLAAVDEQLYGFDLKHNGTI